MPAVARSRRRNRAGADRVGDESAVRAAEIARKRAVIVALRIGSISHCVVGFAGSRRQLANTSSPPAEPQTVSLSCGRPRAEFFPGRPCNRWPASRIPESQGFIAAGSDPCSRPQRHSRGDHASSAPTRHRRPCRRRESATRATRHAPPRASRTEHGKTNSGRAASFSNHRKERRTSNRPTSPARCAARAA